MEAIILIAAFVVFLVFAIRRGGSRSRQGRSQRPGRGANHDSGHGWFDGGGDGGGDGGDGGGGDGGG